MSELIQIQDGKLTQEADIVALVVQVEPNEIHITTDVAILLLPANNVGRNPGFVLEKVDGELKCAAEDADDAHNDIKAALQWFVAVYWEMREALVNWVWNAGSTTVKRNRKE